jgi:hypothetical protein
MKMRRPTLLTVDHIEPRRACRLAQRRIVGAREADVEREIIKAR